MLHYAFTNSAKIVMASPHLRLRLVRTFTILFLFYTRPSGKFISRDHLPFLKKLVIEFMPDDFGNRHMTSDKTLLPNIPTPYLNHPKIDVAEFSIEMFRSSFDGRAAEQLICLGGQKI